jgi:hypothetical protein
MLFTLISQCLDVNDTYPLPSHHAALTQEVENILPAYSFCKYVENEAQSLSDGE